MTNTFLLWLKSLIVAGDIHPFYVSGEWRSLSAYVIDKIDRNECQICKSKGRYRRAVLVHHVNHVKKRPELALDMYYNDAGEQKRNLISVCKVCHETVCHPERMRKAQRPHFMTEERWD